MAKVYTAQELRTVADHMCSDFTFARIPLLDGMSYRNVRSYEVAEMLRQAADALEREEKQPKKYEYAARYDGSLISKLHSNTIDDIVKSADKRRFLVSVVRRPVDEWEEVK